MTSVTVILTLTEYKKKIAFELLKNQATNTSTPSP